MAKGKKRKKARRPSVEDVLAGRLRPGAEQLFALIHSVNPTGEGLPEAESSPPGCSLTRFLGVQVIRGSVRTQ